MPIIGTSLQYVDCEAVKFCALVVDVEPQPDGPPRLNLAVFTNKGQDGGLFFLIQVPHANVDRVDGWLSLEEAS